MSTPSTLAMVHALKEHDLERVSQLLEQGADINERDLDGDTVLHVACYEGLTKVVQQLLGRYARPNATDKSGRTPLHVAAKRGHLDIVELLLDHRAKVLAKDEYGNTPLSEAAEGGHRDIVKLLRSRMNQSYWQRIKDVYLRFMHSHKETN